MSTETASMIVENVPQETPAAKLAASVEIASMHLDSSAASSNSEESSMSLMLLLRSWKR